MIKLLTADKRQIHDAQTLYAGPISTNAFHVLSAYLVSDSSITVSVRTENCNFISAINGDEVEFSNDGNLTEESQAPLFLYPLHIAVEYNTDLEKSKDYESSVTVAIGSEEITFKILTQFEDLDERLAVLLQNEKTQITNDWYYAFRSTDINMIDEKDYVFINRKMREFLMERFRLKHLKGSYKGLESILKFFEYFDFVTVKEYWQSLNNPDHYKQSDILHEISQIDPYNEGYIKTRMIGLFYQINQFDGTFDDDGIPNFVLIDDVDFDQLYAKFNALERFLKLYDYLPDDIRLVDIVGEHSSFNGFDLREWSNIVNIYHNDESLKFSQCGTIEVNEGETEVYIRAHRILVKNNVYTVTDPPGDVELEPWPISSHFIKDIIEIEAIDEELETIDDFDIITKFINADVAVLTASVECDPSFVDEHISFYKISIDKQLNDTEYENVYLTDRYTADTLVGNHRFGVRQVGTYKLTFIVYDYFGNTSTVTSEVEIIINQTDLSFNVAELMSVHEEHKKRGLNFFTTYETINEIGTDLELFVPDANDSDLPLFDINDRPGTARQGFRTYLNGIERQKLKYAVSNFNTVNVARLDRVTLFDTFIWYTNHVFRMFGSTGIDITFRLKKFAIHDWEEVTFTYNTIDDIFAFVSELNNKPDTSVFSIASYELIKYSTDGMAANTEPVLTMFYKTPCLNITDYEFEVEIDGIIYNNSNFDDTILQLNELTPLMNLPAAFRVDYYTPATGDLIIDVDGTETTIVGLTVNTLQDLYDELVNYTECFLVNDILYVNSKESLRVEHPSICTVYDIKRETSAQKYVIKPSGNIFQPYSVIGALIDESIKYENADVKWSILDTFSKDIVYEDNNYALRWFNLEPGIYDVNLEVINVLDGLLMSVTKEGVIKVE